MRRSGVRISYAPLSARWSNRLIINHFRLFVRCRLTPPPSPWMRMVTKWTINMVRAGVRMVAADFQNWKGVSQCSWAGRRAVSRDWFSTGMCQAGIRKTSVRERRKNRCLRTADRRISSGSGSRSRIQGLVAAESLRSQDRIRAEPRFPVCRGGRSYCLRFSRSFSSGHCSRLTM